MTNPNRPAGTAAADIDAAASEAQTTGVQSGVGVSQGAALGASDTQHKTDVNVPELMTGLNGLAQQMSINFQAALNLVAIQTANSNQFHNSVLNQMTIDHRDQLHDRQINIDEQVAAAAILYGRLAATQNNPIPK